MNISIPPAILDLAQPLAEFVGAMVHKLNVNSHKRAITDDDIDGLLQKMADEIDEFREQRQQNLQDPNSLMELVDTSNFAFLLFAHLRARGIRDTREEFIDEYFRVDVEQGRIYCAKTRSGSPHKVGDEIKGTGNPARIRTQHAVSGATISLLRRDIVWWKVFGEWPPLGLTYEDPKAENIDAIRNLLQLSQDVPGSMKRPPFVSQYKPRGRESNKNYGKWVYQRRHSFKLVRVGYWDTPEDAARLGLIAWKQKVKENNLV